MDDFLIVINYLNLYMCVSLANGERYLDRTHPVFVGTGTWVTCHIGPWQSPERFKEKHVSISIKLLRASCFCEPVLLIGFKVMCLPQTVISEGSC